MGFFLLSSDILCSLEEQTVSLRADINLFRKKPGHPLGLNNTLSLLKGAREKYLSITFQPPQGEHPKEKWEPGEKSPEKKPPKTSGRGKQLARMSKEQLKAQVSVKKS